MVVSCSASENLEKMVTLLRCVSLVTRKLVLRLGTRTPEFVLPPPSLCLGTEAAALVPLRHQGGRRVCPHPA